MPAPCWHGPRRFAPACPCESYLLPSTRNRHAASAARCGHERESVYPLPARNRLPGSVHQSDSDPVARNVAR
ncbi:hypothetical protein BMF35_a0398 [Aurantiacibacter gangjinensis]|nr:hypothetical protein BMF35_a0398 [Aurantiacibacter gangjinensis]